MSAKSVAVRVAAGQSVGGVRIDENTLRTRFKGKLISEKIICISLLLITILLAFPIKSVSAAGNHYIYGDGKKSAYSIRLDSPHFGGDVECKKSWKEKLL